MVFLNILRKRRSSAIIAVKLSRKQNGLEKLIEKTLSLEEAALALPAMDRFEHKGVFVIDSF